MMSMFNFFCKILQRPKINPVPAPGISYPQLDISNVIVCLAKYLFYLTNSKTACDCLAWIALYKEFH